MTSSCTAMTLCSSVARDANHYDCSMSLGALNTQGRAVKEAGAVLAQETDEQRPAVLLHVADRLQETSEELLAINARDVAAYQESGAGVDRLTLTPARVDAMGEALGVTPQSPE